MHYSKGLILMFMLLICAGNVQAQKISGTIRDDKTSEPIIGAAVTIKGETGGAITDLDGRFELETDAKPPFILQVTFVGYESLEINVRSLDKAVSARITPKEVLLKGVEITGARVSEKQKEAPLTVESMDIISIKECPQPSFYEALGNLKGVDLTSASLGFTVINTRGFNSTSPVRSLQLIDGVDNQSPGLNFSLGNFLGAPELDVLKVDLIAGASTAYYGPNAFNGVIAMTTRSPFVQPGLEISLKVGERNLKETSVRWAQVLKNKDGKDKFGYKLNLRYMEADDWEANNLSPTIDSRNGVSHGGYDAVNIYGDEYFATNDFSRNQVTNPGLGTYYRTGYAESSLVDYNSENLKATAAFHYKLKDDVELIAASSFGTGTTVYQGDNRYSLKDILFFQNRLELKKENKFFVRVYATNEDAGKSYDAFFTALLLQREAKDDFRWSQDYRNYWALNRIFTAVRSYPGYPQPPAFGDPDYEAKFVIYQNSINPFLNNNYPDSLRKFHDAARAYADNLADPARGFVPFFVPGTDRFDSAFASITSKQTFSEGGSRFFDKSALYHAQAEYKFTPSFMDIITGANVRLYRPNSNGTIFSDTSGIKIENQEYGVYAGLEKRFLDDRLIASATGRYDKNENFDFLISPAASLVYTYKPEHIFRFSFSSAIRNPTLADQYLYYNVGRAILLGNINGYDSLVTIPSLRDAFTGFINIDKLVYFDLDPVRPEKVKTFEIGYRASLFKRLYLDLNYYFSIYRDFIGFQLGADVSATRTPSSGDIITVNNIFRISSNAEDIVHTQGVSAGLNYFIGKYYTISGNYTWNELDKRGSEDPIIPAYNTPKHKYNVGFSARDMEANIFDLFYLRNFGFGVTYKWVKGFLFEGSPQFSGEIDDYGLVDVQLNQKFPRMNSTLKFGASNILNNKHYQVFGGPQIGRLAYVSLLVELTK
ncbi:MAG: TonB-dependent receptor [Bacteroidetes bacterium]|nr:MAG: TonB-dependent receptor [Bacteroidota bacterium]REK03408.1 MAG: TonB-dependent receptor [Bacteroidota bacterium]REK34480.1 MAG: TonB-dependent receptor [Bacteroidota bacterium]REK50402.1 MAG: TonB-dependent receptor [Bacteroidota bacterium]